MTPIRGQHIACLRVLRRALLGLPLVTVLTLSPPMWPGSDPGIALAQDGPLGVTRAADNTAQAAAGASPLNAMKRLGANQRALLNRAAAAANAGKGSRNGQRAGGPQKAYQTSSVNRGAGLPRSGSRKYAGRDATLQGLGQHEYLRLTGRLSGQSCETIEGGVIVRRGC